MVGGLVSGNYDEIIHARTQDFQLTKLMTQDMNGTTGYLENNVGLAPGLYAVDVTE